MTALEIAGKRCGPELRIEASCFGCAHERSESYHCQSDSGHGVYCDHPDATGKRIGDTTWATPDWCPEGAAMLSARSLLKGNSDANG